MGLIAEFYRLVGFAVCHQLPQRSLFVGGRQMPVCARDTGIYIGFLVAFVLIASLERDHPREMPPWPVLIACAVFVGVMAFDGVTSYAGLRPTTNDIRLVTGLLAGFALPPVVFGMLNYQLWRQGSAARVLGTRLHQGIWLAAIPATYVLVRFPIGGAWFLYATVVIAGVLLAFTSVNMVMVTLFPPFERKARRWLDALPFAALGLVLTGFELGAAAWLHAAALRAAGL